MQTQNTPDILERTLDAARRRNASFCEVLVEDKFAFSLERVVDGSVYQPTANEGRSVSVSCVFDGKRVTSSFDNPQILERALDAMVTWSLFLPQASDLAVPEKPYPPATADPASTYDAQTALLDDRNLIEVIRRANAVLEPSGFAFHGMVEHTRKRISYANSVGTIQSYTSTGAHLSIFGFDRRDMSISAYDAVAGKSLGAFPVEELADGVRHKLEIHRDYLARHGGQRIDPFGGTSNPRRFDVIMESPCIAGLLALFSDAWNGKAYEENTSYFSGKLGERVMDERITIYDDPLHPEGIPQPFDYEGNPKKKLVLVENGVAKNVAYDFALAQKYREKYQARGTSIESTGHALPPGIRHTGAPPGHIVVEGGETSAEEMIRASKDPAIWISTLHYIRPTHEQDGRLTGMTIHGAFLVENGEVVGPVRDLRFHESVPEALRRVTHIGRSRPTLSMDTDETLIVPSMRIEKFNFVSVAERKT